MTKENFYTKLLNFILKKLLKLFGNTEYLLECQNCEYKETFSLGGGHTEEFDGHFSMKPCYCPSCQELLIRTNITKDNGETETENDYCPKCGTKTKKFNINKSVRLICPNCKQTTVKITDTESFWMT